MALFSKALEEKQTKRRKKKREREREKRELWLIVPNFSSVSFWEASPTVE